MTLVPRLPMPPNRASRHDATFVAAASLAVAAGLGGTMLLHHLAAVRPARQLPIELVVASPIDVFADDYWSWPAELGTAASMFQCWPARSNRTAASVVVWTDKAGTVVAFGPAREGAQLPAYAASLAREPALDASVPVHVAVQGHAVRTARKRSTLQLKDTKLDCVRSWDD